MRPPELTFNVVVVVVVVVVFGRRWEVDLLSDYPVTEVILYNRQDCCFDRLNGVVIELKDAHGDTVFSIQHDPLIEGVIEDSWKVDFRDVVARKVRVMVQHKPEECDFLNIKDILVMRKFIRPH